MRTRFSCVDRTLRVLLAVLASMVMGMVVFASAEPMQSQSYRFFFLQTWLYLNVDRNLAAESLRLH